MTEITHEKYPRPDRCEVCEELLGWILNPEGEVVALSICDSEDCQSIARGRKCEQLLREAVGEWGGPVGRDESIRGADVVDWLTGFIRRAKRILE